MLVSYDHRSQRDAKEQLTSRYVPQRASRILQRMMRNELVCSIGPCESLPRMCNDSLQSIAPGKVASSPLPP